MTTTITTGMRPMRARTRLLAVTAGVLLVAAACGTKPPERTEVVAELTQNGIVPAYDATTATADGLSAAVRALCDAGEPAAGTLDDARASLAAAREAWLRTAAVRVGPAMTRRSDAYVDWPTDPGKVEEAIANPDVSTDAGYLAKKVGADVRGMQTIEYLLGPPDDDGATVAALSDARRCAYLVGITRVAADEEHAVHAAWHGDGEPAGYPQTLVDDPKAVDELVNDVLNLLQKTINTQLGVALGAVGDGADPGAVVDGPGGFGVADLHSQLDSIRMVLVGNGEQPGLSPLLGDDLTATLRSEIDAADEALDGIEGPLASAVTERPDQVAAARDSLKELQVTVGAEVVSELGVTVGFSDADGDSSG